MLIEIFVTNRKGHIIFREAGQYIKTLSPEYYRQFQHVFCSSTDVLPYFQRGSTHFYHIESDGLRWVGVAGRRLAQLQVLCWLTTLKDAVRSICGAATESVLRANYLILRQLAAEILEDGQMMALDAGRLRSLLLSRPCEAAPLSLSSAGPVSDAQQHVYVDVVESIECVMTSDGDVQKAEVTGRLEVRTEGAACRRVDLSLAKDVRLLDAGAPVEAHLGPQVHVTRLHPAASRSAGWLSAPAGGQITLLEYSCLSGPPPLPIAVTAVARRLDGSSDVELTLRLRLLAAAERRAPSVGVQFRAPAGTGSVSATTSSGGGVRFDRHAQLVMWTVRDLSGQQETTAVIRLADADAAGSLQSVGPFQLNWEISDLTVSGLRVAGVQLPGVPDARTRRWVRHAAVSASHAVQSAPVTGPARVG